MLASPDEASDPCGGWSTEVRCTRHPSPDPVSLLTRTNDNETNPAAATHRLALTNDQVLALSPPPCLKRVRPARTASRSDLHPMHPGACNGRSGGPHHGGRVRLVDTFLSSGFLEKFFTFRPAVQAAGPFLRALSWYPAVVTCHAPTLPRCPSAAPAVRARHPQPASSVLVPVHALGRPGHHQARSP